MPRKPQILFDPNSNAMYDPVSKREVSLEEILPNSHGRNDKGQARVSGDIQHTNGISTLFEEQEQHRDGDAALGDRCNYDKELSAFHESHRRRMIVFGGWKRRMLISELCSVVIVAAIMIAVIGPGLAARKKRDHDANAPQVMVTPPPPPENISVICDVSNVAFPSGYASCQSLCQKAICCQKFLFPEFDIDSCVDGNEITCKEYAPCLSLTAYTGHEGGSDQGAVSTSSHVVFDSGDSKKTENDSIAEYVANVCDISQLTNVSSRKICEDACSARECCFVRKGGNGSCAKENPDWCREYRPCLNLYDGDMVFPGQVPSSTSGSGGGNTDTSTITAGAVSDSLCGDKSILLSSKEARNDCRDICKQAGCCFASLRGEPEYDCNAQFPSWCKEYVACHIFYELEDTVSAKELVEMSSEYVPETGQHEKEHPLVADVDAGNAIHSASTSDDTDDVEDVVDDFAVVVPSDSAGSGNDSDQYVAAWVDEICSSRNLETSDGRAQCERVCRDRSCCHEDDQAKNCAEQLAYWCLPYVSCGNLKKSVGREPRDSADFISGNEDKPAGGFVYHNHGEATPADESFEHAAASASFPNLLHPSSSAVTSSGAASAIIPTPALLATTDPEVDKACDPRRLSSSALRREECKLLCDRRACCFAGPILGCRPELPKWCDEYRSCNYLIRLSANKNPSVGNERDSVDAEKEHGSGFGKSNAEDGDGVDHNAFAAVDVVTTTTTTTTTTSTFTRTTPTTTTTTPKRKSVDELCKSENIEAPWDREKCAEKCKKRGCCFLPLSHGDSCYSRMVDWCEEYSACQPLYPSAPRNPILNSGSESVKSTLTTAAEKNLYDLEADAVTAVVKEEDINATCSDERLSTPEGYETCREACDKRWCCFIQNDWGNCLERFPDACREYAVCKGLYERRHRRWKLRLRGRRRIRHRK